MRKNPKRILGLGMVVAGSILVGVFLGWSLYQTRVLSFDTSRLPMTELANEEFRQPLPVQVEIESVEINLPVEEARIINGIWEISKTGASHWENSANPGENGNVVIYAHNKNSLFGPIRWLELGDVIGLKNSQGQTFQYKVVETVVVNPNTIDYVLPTREERLTLYTCTNFMDKDRYIVISEPIRDILVTDQSQEQI